MKLLLLDSNSLLNRAFYALPMLTDKTGRHTGALFGFSSMLSKLITMEKPTHIVAAFDVHAPTFRHIEYCEYKAHRKPMPEELRAQFPAMKELLRAMGIAVVEIAGYEGDDILGTLALKCEIPTVVVSGDKDCLQLVSDSTTVFYTKKGVSDIIRYDLKRLKEDGLTPEGVIELKALMGDKSDNIPGIAGVGTKTATTLLEKYKTLDNLYKNIEEITGKLKEKLILGKESAYLSKFLATINTNIPIECGIENFVFNPILPNEAKEIMLKCDFRGLINRFSFDEKKQEVLTFDAKNVNISDEKELILELKNAHVTKQFALHFDYDNIYFATDEKNNYCVKCSHDLFGESINYDTIICHISDILNDNTVIKTIFDLKAMYRLINRNPDNLFIADDLMLMSYIADCGKNYENVTEMLKEHGLDGSFICAQMLKIKNFFYDVMIQSNSLKVYTEIELPLVAVLYGMEIEGFKVDKAVLEELSEKYSKELAKLSIDIYECVGSVFNINSPKQLAKVLFDELKLPTGKKRSTSADILIELEDLHPIIPLILRYRQLSKLVSTYLISMKNMLDASGRIHTIFNQALTTTGRLSSSEPNLQNIPVREVEGREIRRAFIPSSGNMLISADYSQIELRLLAHYADDDTLIKAFSDGKDIHSITASKVFNIDDKDVTPKMRRDAKAVNFGIIYGISDFGLAKNIGSNVKTAKEFILKYFESYPKIKEFMDKSVAFAKEHGFISTLMNRIRALPEIASYNFSVRSFGERAAMNMPLQGSAADIIKLAMIKVDKAIKNKKLNAKLILQVHDELIIDCPIDEVEIIKDILKQEMENVISLKVPLTVNVEVGLTWKEAK